MEVGSCLLGSSVMSYQTSWNTRVLCFLLNMNIGGTRMPARGYFEKQLAASDRLKVVLVAIFEILKYLRGGYSLLRLGHCG